MEIGFEVHLTSSFEEAVERVTQALRTEGFGILTRIDVHKTLKEKLEADFRPYAILGACNPVLAHKALSTEPMVGLMLPCNITVEADPNGGCLVRIANPEAMMQVGGLGGNSIIQEVASQARRKLESVAALLLQ